jgi:hypothetical protein
MEIINELRNYIFHNGYTISILETMQSISISILEVINRDGDELMFEAIHALVQSHFNPVDLFQKHLVAFNGEGMNHCPVRCPLWQL